MKSLVLGDGFSIRVTLTNRSGFYVLFNVCWGFGTRIQLTQRIYVLLIKWFAAN